MNHLNKNNILLFAMTPYLPPCEVSSTTCQLHRGIEYVTSSEAVLRPNFYEPDTEKLLKAIVDFSNVKEGTTFFLKTIKETLPSETSFENTFINDDYDVHVPLPKKQPIILKAKIKTAPKFIPKVFVD